MGELTIPVKIGGKFDFFVSVLGNDSWSGKLDEPDAAGTDGPFATICQARDAIRLLKQAARLDGPVNVWIRGGHYDVAEAIEFTPSDSAPVRYCAYPGEIPVISGGKRITGWRKEQVGNMEMWIADVPEVASGKRYFRQLFVNGERRSRPCLPKSGFYWIKDVPETEYERKELTDDIFKGSDTFICAEGDIRNWKSIDDVEVVAFHYWVEERMPIRSFDVRTGTVTSSRKSRFALKDDIAKRFAKYKVENVFEALSVPGEWYLDRASGKVFYIPLPGEDIEKIEAVAGYAPQLLKLVGNPQANDYVEHLRFQGITFRHNEWRQPEGRGSGLFDGSEVPFESGVDYAADAQAACSIPGAIHLAGARSCSIEDCTIEHTGTYGIEIASGCAAIRIVGNVLRDLGAGGVKLGGADAAGALSERTGGNRITDNHISGGGRVFHSAVGILSIHSFDNIISHNHIHDLYYTGISCGWVWGYEENVSKNNRIENNHIHDLGHGLLSDMGGIYTLGVQPGTVIRGNRIHDIEKCNYGGWAIYPDEGSSHLLIENNVCYRTSSTVFNQHYGRENIVRNNIFAFGREGQVSLGRAEAHRSFTFEKNIVVSNGQPFFIGGRRGRLEQCGFASDLNLLWDMAGKDPVSGNGAFTAQAEHFLTAALSMADMKRLGYELHSIVTDPQFNSGSVDAFELMEGSPAFALGFKPIDFSETGPRPGSRRD